MFFLCILIHPFILFLLGFDDSKNKGNEGDFRDSTLESIQAIRFVMLMLLEIRWWMLGFLWRLIGLKSGKNIDTSVGYGKREIQARSGFNSKRGRNCRLFGGLILN
ncbi:hypothetical protein L2E82_16964 [Cichorium intybus]|uniref:Uncharacterized protein n=1 Tax=Cichorium intybus TaxID=13427 RepID=A0ACB9F899_CICIN|nr:hypothetical protein L2E82_16964 [Cichorium intybus]